MAAPPVIDICSSPAGTQSRIPPSSHRLATVSASDALQDLEDSTSSYVRTGIRSLDAALSASTANGHGGLERSKITETWGPNGAGATAIALQASAHALQDGHGVVWPSRATKNSNEASDCATPLPRDRIELLLAEEGALGPAATAKSDKLHRFKQISAPTLSHLLALVLHPPAQLFAESTAVFVIDNLNILLDLDYPRAQAMGSSRSEAQKWQAGRRYAVLGCLITALNKLAALNNLAVIVTTGCAMRSRSDAGLGGALAPGLGGAEWDAGVWNRLVVFRDFAGRFVGVQKCGGKSLISREELGEPGRIIGFDVSSEHGALQERHPGKATNGAMATTKLPSSPVKSRKRYFDEVADSDGEDEYGWDAGDENVFVSGTVAPEVPATNERLGQNEGEE